MTWGQDIELKKLIVRHDQLPKYTEDKRGDIDKVTNKLSELKEKLEKSDKLKEDLRQGGLLGELVGIHLLSRTKSDQNLLKEPLVLLGTDLTINYLRKEQENNEEFKKTDRYANGEQDLKDLHESVIKRNNETIEELGKFRERIKTIQNI